MTYRWLMYDLWWLMMINVYIYIYINIYIYEFMYDCEYMILIWCTIYIYKLISEEIGTGFCLLDVELDKIILHIYPRFC